MIYTIAFLTIAAGLTLIARQLAYSFKNEALLSCVLLLAPNMQVLYQCFLIKIELASLAASACRFFTSSNHFILSLDIIFFFSSLMLILYNILKLDDSLSVK
ncbi:hypothetical protein [Lutispora saccharofermentans]|uniref:Uncharacterized protein n=1 Tax=Lutispora saccharofermentans TaxID=3024236 RepID=A0ABT1NEI2_9FIRM|nr:hypothetical protein [Lutispora saccharofermentans]MCQ1529680.1 hypothetical protein [Lutispora saccharofermentans]